MATTLVRVRHRITRFLVSAVIALVAACVGDGPTEPVKSNPPADEPTTPPTLAPNAAGVLVLTVTGLDAGQAADIILSGPGGYSRAVTTSGSVTGLVAGRYTIQSRAVIADGQRFCADSVIAGRGRREQRYTDPGQCGVSTRCGCGGGVRFRTSGRSCCEYCALTADRCAACCNREHANRRRTTGPVAACCFPRSQWR